MTAPEGTAAAAETGNGDGNGNGERTTAQRPSRFGPPRDEIARFIELFALSGLVIAQPVFDFLGKNARITLIFRLSVTNVSAFVVLVLLVPPAVVWLAETAVGAVLPRLRNAMHAVIVCVVLGVLAGNYLKVSTHLGAAPRIATSVVATVLVALVMRRTAALRQWLRFLAIAPLVFALLFVTASPASILLFQDAKAANVKIAHPARVIMIVFDEFPEESLFDGTGHVDAGLFPNFAALASDSTLYRNETTVAEYTGRAVPAILTGRYPALNSALPISSKYPQSLFTLLGKTYTMHAHEFYEQLCPVSMCAEPTFKNPVTNMVGAGDRVLHNLMDLDRASWDHNAGFRFGLDVPPGFEPARVFGEHFLASLQPSTKPTLDYLHVLLPHRDWRYLAGGRDRGANTVPLSFFLARSPFKVSLGRQMHLLNVQSVDWLLGQVIDKLKALGEYDKSMIVITADHGVAFPYRRDASVDEYPSIMWTPLFIKAPDQAAGRVDDQPMLSIDVLPTMADLLGVKIPWKIDGRSALGPPRPFGPVTIIRNDIGKPGRKQTFDGPKGFQTVISARAAPPGGDQALRLYRIGIYGKLIDQPAAPLLTSAVVPPTGALTTRSRWEIPDPNAESVPWSASAGTVSGPPAGSTIAVAVNGRIAGLALTQGLDTRFFANLAPTLFRAGTNVVTPYLVTGPASKPGLIAILPRSDGVAPSGNGTP